MIPNEGAPGDYADGMHAGARIARSLAKIGENCNAKPCCVAATRAVEAAILAEADEECTPITPVKVSDALMSIAWKEDGR